MKQNNPWVDFFLDDIKAANIMLKEELYNLKLTEVLYV